jgi:hypothetical protein
MPAHSAFPTGGLHVIFLNHERNYCALLLCPPDAVNAQAGQHRLQADTLGMGTSTMRAYSSVAQDRALAIDTAPPPKLTLKDCLKEPDQGDTPCRQHRHQVHGACYCPGSSTMVLAKVWCL